MLGSALSNQVGAALGAHAFGAIGPPGVVAVRQVVAAAVLLPVARPPLRRMTWPQWWPVAAARGGVRLHEPVAVHGDRPDRAGAGSDAGVPRPARRGARRLPVAPGTAHRRRRGGRRLRAGPAGAAPATTSGWGSGCSPAACWAAYIVLNRVAGARLPGLQAPAVATALCALAYLPVLVLLAVAGRLTGRRCWLRRRGRGAGLRRPLRRRPHRAALRPGRGSSACS